MADHSQISLKIEFAGGLELLFDNKRSHNLSVPSKVANTIKPEELVPSNVFFLIHHLRDTLLKEREELFIENGTVRPGILVLINDTDWELEGEGDYELKDGDQLVFISTLHGG